MANPWSDKVKVADRLERVPDEPQQRALSPNQTLTFTQSEVEALWLCIFTAQCPDYPTTPATMTQAHDALRRETRGPQ